MWDFDVLTVVGIMFTDNCCGNFLLRKHICYFHGSRMSGHFNVRKKIIIIVSNIKDIFCLKEEKHVVVLKNAVLLPP